VFQFLFPWFLWALLAGASALFFYLVQNWESAKNLLYVWWFYMIPPMGKEVIIPRTLAQDHHPPALVVALATSCVDMILSLFLIWNYDWVKKVPVLGPKLIEAEDRGRERIEKTNWFKRASFIATAMFVSVPFSGAGGWFGTVFGRLMGLKPYKVLLAVFIGSTIEAFGYAIAANALVDLMEGSSIFAFISNVNILQIFAVFVVFALVVYVVRHPREAVKKSSRAVRRTFRLSENAVLKMEGLSKKTTEITIMESGRTIDNLKKLGGEVLDSVPDLQNMNVRILERGGFKIIKDVRDLSFRILKEGGEFAGETFKEGIEWTGSGTERTIGKASELTIIGMEMVIEGVEKGEYIILMTGDKVEKVFKLGKGKE
jgi:uncharacterized membrane protein